MKSHWVFRETFCARKITRSAFSVPTFKSMLMAARVSVSTLLALTLVPISMFIAAQGWLWTLMIFCSLPPALTFLMRYHIVTAKKRTQFFLWWAITSLTFLLCVFEFEVVPFLEILFSENFFLICWFTAACFFAHLTRQRSFPAVPQELKNDVLKCSFFKEEWPRCEICSLKQPPRSSHCRLCGFCIVRRDHHNLWLDVCVGSQNHRFYVGFLAMLVIACCYYANLTLTTVCHPTLIGGLFLFPDDCSDAYGEIHITICFVSALYALLIAVAAILTFFQQCWLVCQNSTLHEWRQGESGIHNKGPIHNCAEFWYNCY